MAADRELPDFYAAALATLEAGAPGLSPDMRRALAVSMALRCRAALRASAGAGEMRGEDAEHFARRVHAGQVDKAGLPYAGHLGRVAARARAYAEAMGLSRAEAQRCWEVGWLHDVIEDGKATSGGLSAAGFDLHVVQAVVLLSRPKGMEYFDYVKSIVAVDNRVVWIVKLSDLEDNSDPARRYPASRSLASRYGRALAMVRNAPPLADGGNDGA